MLLTQKGLENFLVLFVIYLDMTIRLSLGFTHHLSHDFGYLCTEPKNLNLN